MVAPARDHRDDLYEAYLRVPAHRHPEIVNGTLYVMSRPAPRLALKHTEREHEPVLTSFHVAFQFLEGFSDFLAVR